MLFLTVSEGDDPETRRPILASTDPALIQAVLDHLTRRFRTRPAAPPLPVRALRPPGGPEGGAR